MRSLVVVFLLLFCCLLAPFSAKTQQFETFQYGEGANTYTVFIPSVRKDTCELVLFLHGHGASNALVYGSWIRHLLEQGRMVIFPQYQENWAAPVVTDAQFRVQNLLSAALAHLSREQKITVKNIHVIGHSLGGMIGANVVATTQLPDGMRFASLALIEPGAWFLRPGTLDNFDSFPSDLRLLCITGKRDVIAARRFARFVMEHSPSILPENKAHFEVRSIHHKKENITSGHIAPAGPDMAFDTHNRNLTIGLAKSICTTDLTDQKAFWTPVDHLLSNDHPLSECGDLGNWSDGTPVAPLRRLE